MDPLERGSLPTNVALVGLRERVAELKEEMLQLVLDRVAPGEVAAEHARLRALLESPSLDRLVADLGGVPRFYEYLVGVLVDLRREWD